MKPSILQTLEGAKLVNGKIVLITGVAALDANGGSLMM